MDKKKYLILLLFIVTIFKSCTYSNMEDFCPEAEICDTLMVSFSEDILPVFNFHCKSCHSGAQPAGNLMLTNHEEIEAEIGNNIIDRINRDNSDNLLMPPAGKLDDCVIEKIIAWKNQGSLNN